MRYNERAAAVCVAALTAFIGKMSYGENMKISGTVLEIVYRNVENGYSVVWLDVNPMPCTAVGIFPPVTEGEIVEAEGEWVTNSKFGEQFAVEQVTVKPPTTKDAVFKYLSSGLFKGIGEVTAYAIVEKFGENALNIIETDPAKLAEVKGISVKKAMAIGETYMSLREMQETIVYLQGYGVPLNTALRIYKAYEASTRRIIEHNPYQLVDDVDGIGFITADKIAKLTGIPENSKFRISAALVYLLKDAMEKNGHTYLPRTELINETDKLLALDDENTEELIADALCDCEVEGRIVRLEKDGKEVIMHARNYVCEQSVSAHIVSLINTGVSISLDVEKDLEEYEKLHKLTLHEGQRAAIRSCLDSGVNVITGGPGTGKTTIIRCIIEILRARNYSVCLCAPTGRAAKRLAEATGLEAKTIHRLLDLDFTDGKGRFRYNENTKLEQDVVIVDEVSMCDEYVFNALIKSIKYGGRLIMVGDKDQLPSVGAGNVLADVISCGIVPVSYLTHIYRQGEDSYIVTNAHRINKGLMPVIDNKCKDFFVDNKADATAALNTITDMVARRIPSYAGVSSKDIQVLCPMKKGIIGVENMNTRLQETLNPFGGKPQLQVGNRIFRKGDKVMHIVNDYQLEWQNPDDLTTGTGVFNGDIGYIEEIDEKEPSILVAFDDGKRVRYRQGDFDELTLAYAISVHKSQGSEFPVVIIAVTSGNYMILTRNLLYTAVTRAKNMVVLVGATENIEKMVKNNYTAKRYSLLSDFIKDAYKRKNG